MKPGKLVVLFVFLFQMQLANLMAAGNIGYANESMFIHTDRDMYISGENLFFKLYVIDENTHKLSTTSKIAYIVLRGSDNTPIANLSLQIQNGMAYGNIYLNDTLATGSYQLVAFTNWMKNKGENSFFYNEILIANLFDKELGVVSTPEKPEPDSSRQRQFQQIQLHNPLLQVTTDKTTYLKREKIRLKIAFKEIQPENASIVSVSVHETMPGMDFPQVDNLGQSGIKPGFAKNPLPGIAYLPEIKGRIIPGKVVDAKNNKGAANCKVLLSAVDTVVNLQYTETDTAGCFSFLLNDYYNNKEFIISIMENPGGNQLNIVLENKFKIDSLFHPARFSGNSALKAFVMKSQDIVYIQKNYGLEPKISIRQQPATTCSSPLIYYKPDSKVYPSDYVPLPDFTEISRELLPAVRMRKQNQGYSLALIDRKQQGFSTAKPAVFFNGVMIDDINQVVPLGSTQLQRIETVNSPVVCGSLFFEGGILAVFAKEKGIRNMKINPNALVKTLEIYSPYTILETPQPTAQSANDKPDFRQLLYWNPDIIISGTETTEIEFYASEHTGNYTIKIEGVTSKGEIISATTYFNIQ